jgi:long-chain acyl-CoA synthetase
MLKKIINIGSIINLDKDQEKIAIIDLSLNTPRYLSYKDLNNSADAVARGLQKKGITVGDKIAILSANCHEYVSTLFGILRLGAVAVLINNKLSSSQIDTILKESNSKLIFTNEELSYNIESINWKVNFDRFLDPGLFNHYVPNDDDMAFLLYTSGSKGNPKGAIITHKSHSWVFMRYNNHDTAWAEKRISLISAPLYHANGLTTTEMSIYGHATIIMLPKFEPITAIKAIEKFKVNTIFCVPTMIAMMIQEKEAIENHDVSSVRNIRSASSAVGHKLLDNVKKYFPNAAFLNSYGITEVGPGLFGPHPDGLPRPARSVGYPSAGIEYKLVDKILQIKSPSMMTAYYTGGTSDSITPDGFFITNDIFEIDENGFYYFVGRNDDMFKCGANKIYPSEVESILESHPAVNSSFVLSLPDEIKGAKPYAFVVLEKGQTPTESDLKNYCLDYGPAYQHPRRVWIIDKFPLTGSNKVDGQLLKQIAIKKLENKKP